MGIAENQIKGLFSWKVCIAPWECFIALWNYLHSSRRLFSNFKMFYFFSLCR